MGRTRKNTGTCQAPVPGGCLRPAVTAGLCATHYQRKRKGVGGLDRPVPFFLDTCTVCGSPAVARGLCMKHYQQNRRHEVKEKKAAEAQAGKVCMVPVSVPPEWMPKFSEAFPRAVWSEEERTWLVMPEDEAAARGWLK